MLVRRGRILVFSLLVGWTNILIFWGFILIKVYFRFLQVDNSSNRMLPFFKFIQGIWFTMSLHIIWILSERGFLSHAKLSHCIIVFQYSWRLSFRNWLVTLWYSLPQSSREIHTIFFIPYRDLTLVVWSSLAFGNNPGVKTRRVNE